jgi:ATP-dependent RNA helicase DHX57
MAFCKDNFLSVNSLFDISKTRQQYLETLLDLGYLPRDYERNILKHNPESSNINILKSALYAGLHPNLAIIKTPDQKFAETAHGAFPVDHEASKIRFFDETERVFIHPASFNKSLGNFDEPFLTYVEKIRTSMVFLRDTTSVSPWPILLFGGSLKVDHHHNIITIGDHAKIEAFPRVGGRSIQTAHISINSPYISPRVRPARTPRCRAFQKD